MHEVMHPENRILIAEDNEANLFVLTTMLKMAGHWALIARDGDEAVSVASREHPSLILMDISMPRLSGVDAARQIRAATAGERPAIVAVTANATQRQRDECAAAGFDGFLTKPVDRGELLEVVGRYVA